MVFMTFVSFFIVKIAQDVDWIIRVSRNYKVYIHDEILVEQFIQNDSISYMGSSEKIISTYLYWLDKYENELEENPRFKLAVLKILCDHMSRIGRKDTADYYKMVFEIERNCHNFACYFLSVMHLMPVVKNVLRRSSRQDDIFYI